MSITRNPVLFICGIAFALVLPAAKAADLPLGPHPAAIEYAHFPTRAHAVVWRNWQCIPPARIARVIGASAEQVHAMAGEMGLPRVASVSPRIRQRAYITLIRRNWHLLPYEQLLELLDMTVEELDFILREDDFLFVKLGHLKPRCEPVRYRPPDAATRQRVEEIREITRKYFGDATTIEPPFQFVQDLSSAADRAAPSPRVSNDAPRYIYSYFGVFGDPLWDPQLDPYPDGLLMRLARCDVNGVWLHVVLRDLAPGGVGEHHFGFMRDAGPKRLESAGLAGIPQIISTCSVNHMTPAKSRYKPEFHQRRKYDLDKYRTWLRLSPGQLDEVATIFAAKLNRATGPVKILVPLRGWSSVDSPGNPTYDPAEDRGFVEALKRELRPEIVVREVDAHMEEPAFAKVVIEVAREIFV